ncbi:M20 family metallopeptidase [Ramlibacter tataouinensis]|uniref:M20 aminoacylase family protein n=1 Tax=Ramlibacter tataouinensis TaxID=94132 RepID=UPI0022F3C77C|nr:M20 aminoacylase family protein [Ramlibacter tataouinensis]WBY01227.1 M20 family metallopeptidase [Ramlibacter tataouinensis]
MAHPLVDALQQSAPEFIALRRDIHRHPELGLKEDRTSELVAQRLQSWGYEVHSGLARTGVVARLKRGNGKRRLGLRADMDALPLQEHSGREWASVHPGVMHACGHDGHTAMLLAAARHLAMRGEFSGTLNLIFQPAEEHPGGARLMIEQGLFERFPCDAVFAMHNMPGTPQGDFVFRDGPAMASSDDVIITVRGQGGHGAMPHRATDPIVAASSIVLALQTVVSRNVDPQQTAVVTVGSFQAGAANNVIPDSARLLVSVRALDRGVRDLLQQRITALAQAQAASYGLEAGVEYLRDYPVLVNTPAETEFARRVAIELVGADKVVAHGPAQTGSEDFAVMLEHCPGAYVLIGNGDGEGTCMVHNPGYDFNDGNVAVGAAFWCLLAERFLTD